MNTRSSITAVACLALTWAGCAEDREMGDLEDQTTVDVEPGETQAPQQSTAIEEMVAQLRGDPGRTIYLPAPDLGRPTRGSVGDDPGQEAVERDPGPPADTLQEGERANGEVERGDAQQDTTPAPPDTTGRDTARTTFRA